MPEVERVVVTREEAADMYGVKPDVISRAIHATEGPTLKAKRNGRRYAIHVDDLRAWWDQLPNA